MREVPEKEIRISEHSVFPSVYVWVRQRRAWKLHQYILMSKCYFTINTQFGTSLKF